jgi:hypothetical protein
MTEDLRKRLLAAISDAERGIGEYARQTMDANPEMVCGLRGLEEARRLLMREAAGASLPAQPRFDPANHHNALACPYCNPDRLTLTTRKGASTVRCLNCGTPMNCGSPEKAEGDAAPRLALEGWRDISSAPKDGTAVLVVGPKSIAAVVAKHEGEWGWVTMPGRYSLKPTLWQPLPPAPDTSFPTSTEEGP